MIKTDSRLIPALDTADLGQVKQLVNQLYPQVDFYKVGLQLFVSHGPEVINWLKGKGCKVFVDLKLHDIPNTVSQAAIALANLEVDMLNIHLSGGKEMAAKMVEAVHETCLRRGKTVPALIGVTVLTSTGPEAYADMGYADNIEQRVARLAVIGQQAGLDGVVASPRETSSIRQSCGKDFLIVTPGIRPVWAAKDDQQRITTPSEAIKLGADYLVVGRPITKADRPLEAAETILAEMEGI